MDLIKMLNEKGVMINNSFEFEEIDLIDRKEELKLDQDLEFAFKEMKIDKDLYHLLNVSLSAKIKADCNYKAILYLCPRKYNARIRTKYHDLGEKIEELFEDIQKGGLFNTEDRMNMQVKTLKEYYDNMMEEIHNIHEEYQQKSEVLTDYIFGCSVKSLENTSTDVKKCSFLIGSEAFVDIATRVKQLNLFRLGLIIE